MQITRPALSSDYDSVTALQAAYIVTPQTQIKGTKGMYMSVFSQSYFDNSLLKQGLVYVSHQDGQNDLDAYIALNVGRESCFSDPEEKATVNWVRPEFQEEYLSTDLMPWRVVSIGLNSERKDRDRMAIARVCIASIKEFVAIYGMQRQHLFATYVSNPVNLASQNLQLRRVGGTKIATIDFEGGRFGFPNFQRTLVAHNIKSILSLADQFSEKIEQDSKVEA